MLGGVPNSLPPLVKSYRMQEKASGVGFDWDNGCQLWDKVIEELGELKAEAEQDNNGRAEEEMGDLFFALVNYSRFIDVNPEDALEKANKKFKRRFQYLEEHARKDGKVLYSMTLEEMDKYWEEAKRLENKNEEH